MTRHDSRRGASNLAVPLMLVSFVAIGGLMYWLSVTAEPTQVEIVEEEAPEDTFMGTVVDAGQLEGRAVSGYEGMTIRVEGIPFAQGLGDAQFFVNLPQGTPFLVRKGEELLGTGMVVPNGPLTVTGVLHPMSDSVTAAWQADGTVDDANLPLVEFAAHYIEAQEITVAEAPAQPETGDTTGTGGGEG